MTVAELIALLVKKHGAHAFVLQHYQGRWRASIRTANGISHTTDASTPIVAVMGMVERLGNPPQARKA